MIIFAGNVIPLPPDFINRPPNQSVDEQEDEAMTILNELKSKYSYQEVREIITTIYTRLLDPRYY